MNRMTPIARTLSLGVLAAACGMLISGCIYEIPITAKATRKVDARLVGNWSSRDGKNRMKVAKLDDSTYVVWCNGDLYRAYHSDVGGAPFVSVQSLESDKPSYAYWEWTMTADGTLSLRNVNDRIVPDSTKDSASVRRLLEDNLKNPDLLGEEIRMTKGK